MSSFVSPEMTVKTVQTAFDNPQVDEHNNPANVDSHGRLPEEIKFDKRVYGGISYFGQAATGIVLTNWLKHGGGQRHFTQIAEWLGPKFMTLVSKKKGPAAVEEATATIIVSTMIMVGNTFILPVKWLENRKPQIVRGMTESSNRRREAAGEVISPEELAAQQHYLTILAAKPKQSWMSLILGRGFALAGVYATLWGITNPRNKIMEDMTASTVKEGLHSVGLTSLAKSKTVENYSRIAFYDFFYSAVSASGLYIYSHLLHPVVSRTIFSDGKDNTLKEEPVMPPLEEGMLEAVNNPHQFARNHKLHGKPGTPTAAMNVESMSQHPQPQAEVHA